MKKILSNKLWMSALASDLISNFGDVVFYLALMNYVLVLPDPKYAIAIITLSETVPPLFGVFIGYFADKARYKIEQIISTQIVRSVLYVIVGLLLGFTPALWVVVVIAIINLLSDLLGGYENCLYIPISVNLISNDLREQASAFRQTVSQVMNVVFKSVSALLVVIISYQNLAYINAMSFVLAALVMLYVSKGLKEVLKKHEQHAQVTVKENVETTSSKQHFFKSFMASAKASYNVLKDDKELLVLLAISPLFNAIFAVIQPLSVLMISAEQSFVIGNQPTTIALMSIMMTVSAIVGSLLSMSVFKNRSLFFVVLGICFSCIGVFISTYLVNIYMCLMFLSMLMIFTSALQPKLNARVINSLPQDNLALLIGFLGTYAQSGMLIMSVLFSILVTIMSAQMIALLFAVMFIGVTAIYMKQTLRVK